MTTATHTPSPLTHNGTFTVESFRTGEHRTFKVWTQHEDADFAAGERLVALMTGPDNTSSFQTFGFVKRDRIVVFKKYRGGQIDKLARMLERLEWFVENDKVGVHAETGCRRCGRKLTTPESVQSGIGPKCAERE